MRSITKKRKRQVCKTCHKPKFKISLNGNCVACATEKVQLARLQIKHKSGKAYESWKQNLITSLIGNIALKSIVQDAKDK